MVRQIIFSILALFLLSPSSSRGCQCDGPRDFITTVDSVFYAYWYAHESTDALVVVKGVITGLTANQHGVRYKPLQHFYGHTYSDTVTIWGTDGTDCRLNIVDYYSVPADTMILLMNRNINRDYLYEDTSDFRVARCGTRYLIVRNDSVFGGSPGTFAFNGYPLNAFEDSLAHLLHSLKVEPAVNHGFDAVLSPNPASENQTLRLQGTFLEGISVDIFDFTGRFVRRLADIKSPSSSTLNSGILLSIKGLTDGLYYLQIVSSTRRQIFPLTVISP